MQGMKGVSSAMRKGCLSTTNSTLRVKIKQVLPAQLHNSVADSERQVMLSITSDAQQGLTSGLLSGVPGSSAKLQRETLCSGCKARFREHALDGCPEVLGANVRMAQAQRKALHVKHRQHPLQCNPVDGGGLEHEARPIRKQTRSTSGHACRRLAGASCGACSSQDIRTDEAFSPRL